MKKKTMPLFEDVKLTKAAMKSVGMEIVESEKQYGWKALQCTKCSSRIELQHGERRISGWWKCPNNCNDDSMKTDQLTIMIAPGFREAVEEEAAERNVSVSSVIEDAIHDYYAAGFSDSNRRKGIREFEQQKAEYLKQGRLKNIGGRDFVILGRDKPILDEEE